MAYMVPEYIPKNATAGERLLFETLKRYLPSDYIVYYEPEIRGRRPDFVIIGPDLGLVVLEVKDYTKNTLHQINQDEWMLHTSAGETRTVKSPLKQARDNARLISDQLKKDKNLLQGLSGYLKFSYGYGTVFTRLKQEDFIKLGLYNVIDPSFVLCRDEIDTDDEGFSSETLMEKLFSMFTIQSKRRYTLTDEDIQAIRFHLFPEVRISAEFKEPVPYQDQLLLSLHNIKTMDMHQENMAKQLGDRHRLIRGVAGSGKTLVLVSRAKMLAQAHPDWKILVLCYGIPLSRTLKQWIDQKMREPEDLFDFANAECEWESSNIEVYNFHEWLGSHMRIKDSAIPELLEKLDKSEAIVPIYDAILIDEGQDFEPDWLRLASHCLNPDTKSLLLVEDRAQSIFKRKNSLAQETGLDFRGRSKILSINYRNTAQIVQFAWDFYRSHSQLQNKVQSGSLEGVEIIPPQSTKRKGPEPIFRRCRNIREEMDFIVKSITFLRLEKAIPLNDIAILYRVQNSYKISYINEIKSSLQKHQVPYTWMTESRESKRNFIREEETVKISTLDSAKGLDFRAVFIVAIENMPFKREEVEEREVSLLYIGMTRALEWLFLTYSGESKYTLYLDDIQQKITKTLGPKPSG
ncbi:superfamily I DNA/RNA helicase [Paenibacillus terrae HPL-003]|uniref:Superfamily I DNA/RNA helicase n=1 Tax=Paenibacillus terrae (strain HPL-003) TaxID=985665 RepID=G7W2J8_PAETH|nr:nuclease-related domain-containing DEAD/DEAH box helicase [Paenibacillus terrae]AET60102.1 superfamily I DNA/RNA helicase [Paenibacillus terrae HPL-003]